ncbi:hypothetical protein AURDEDRAFT_163822 [Auricularia subglabra TFB-10046 SS5]|nr:hypothetical protein AURDEDRAFT_163822 [Auricularia subglabra TFB-10046 SS5]
MSGAAPGIRGNPAFPAVLLADVFDYLHLRDLLLAAMPVSRYWRQSVINHRLYWYDLELRDHGPDNVIQSGPLFSLRLSRTEARLIRVRVEYDDPGVAIFTEIAQHLSQITFLYLLTSPGCAGQAIQSFRAYGAPSLTDFHIASWSKTPDSAPIAMPADLFASRAPQLRNVSLSDIELAPGPLFPVSLVNVTFLSYSIASDRAAQLPNVFLECPRLQRLSLQGTLALEDPVFMEGQNWERLREVSFNIFGLDANQLPIAGVRRVKHHCYHRGTNTVINAARSLTEPLSINFHWHHGLAGGAFKLLRITMRSAVKQPAYEREIETQLPVPPPGAFPRDPISAFQNPPLVGNIVRLVLANSNWDDLVGLGYLAAFPALGTSSSR